MGLTLNHLEQVQVQHVDGFHPLFRADSTLALVGFSPLVERRRECLEYSKRDGHRSTSQKEMESTHSANRSKHLVHTSNSKSADYQSLGFSTGQDFQIRSHFSVR